MQLAVRRLRALSSWIFVSAAFSCSGSGVPPNDSGVGSDFSIVYGSDGAVPDLAPRTPLNHRVDDSQCQGVPPPGNCPIGGSRGTCRTDNDCTAGINGRCSVSGGGIRVCGCAYDTCANDESCGAGQLCACHGSKFTSGGNTCVTGICRVDADCGTGAGYCSPSANTMGCGIGLGGYYCHTASDQCLDDGDCMNPMNVALQCAWSMSGNRWECLPRVICP